MMIDFTSVLLDEVGIEDHSQWKTSTFSGVYEKAEQALGRILKQKSAPPEAPGQRFKALDCRSNIIAFAGDRGSGKTSAMLSFVKACVEGKLSFQDAGGRPFVFCMLPPIEPAKLSRKETIAASVASQIYGELEDRLRGSSDRPVDQALVTRIANQCAAVREAIRVQGLSPQDLLQDSFDELSQLSLLAQTKRLRESLRELIDSYLTMQGQGPGQRAVLLLPVDDIDTSIPNAYQLTEELQNHLMLPNVVVTLALKPEQLSDTLEQQFISEFRDLCRDRRRMDTQPAEMAAKYLQKLISPQRQIELPDLTLSSTAGCRVRLDGEAPQPLARLFLSLTADKTGILLAEDQEGGHPLIPRNLRVLHQTLLLLRDMEDVSALKGAQGRQTLLSQLDNLEGWLLSGLPASRLPAPLCEILRLFSAHADEGLPAFLWRSLAGYLNGQGCAAEVQGLLERETRNENISLGDVLYLLTLLRQTDAEDHFAYFGAAVRLLCSIRIRRQMTAALPEDLGEGAGIPEALQAMPEEGYRRVWRILNGLIYDPAERITYDGLERMCNIDALSAQAAVPADEKGKVQPLSLYGGLPVGEAVSQDKLPAECMTLAEAAWVSLFVAGFDRVRRHDIHTLEGSALRGILRPSARHMTNMADLESGDPAFVSANWMAFPHNLLCPGEAVHRLLWQVEAACPAAKAPLEEAVKEFEGLRFSLLFSCLHLDSVDFWDAVIRHMADNTAAVCQEAGDDLATMNGYFHVKAGLEKAVEAVGKRTSADINTKALSDFLDRLPKETDETRYEKYNWLRQR